jgi:hypothetical protein
MTTKTVNYTPEQTAAVVADYKAGVSVEQIAAAVGKSVRSVVAKLSREGVYMKKEYKTKTGDAVVKKDELASELMLLANLTEAEADSLAKANKTALAKLIAIVKANVVSDANDVS